MIDMSKEARAARRKEFNGLKNLPFLSLEQTTRLRLLRTQVVVDNQYAFKESKND